MTKSTPKCKLFLDEGLAILFRESDGSSRSDIHIGLKCLIPSSWLQAILGEGAAVVLEGQRVVPAKAEEAGFNFKFPEVVGAVRNILR